MPIYEYECNSCDYHFERKQGFDAEPIAVCPKCAGVARRIFLPTPVIFKGSGFYVTDSRGGNGGREKATEYKESKKAEPDKTAAGGEKG